MGIKKQTRKAAVIAVFMASLLTLTACKEPDPYEGMVQVSNGAGGQMWITVIDELEVSAFAAEDFYADGEYINYRGEEYRVMRGIDVSEHQLEIDWDMVRSDGVEFAIIRAGYRGYSEGTLNEDKYFRQNIEGALSSGLKVGIYFFSQAIDISEAEEEARFMLEIIDGYNVTLPVFYDWEAIGVDEARTDNLTGSEITDFALAFSDIVRDAGYEPGVYFYRSIGYYDYKLDMLKDLVFWSAAPGIYPDFYYAHTVWQYSFTAQVSGIEPATDLNIYFEKIPEPES